MSNCLVSICIPCFNSDLSELCLELNDQIASFKLNFEILVIDDCSSEHYKIKNSKLQENDKIRIKELKENIGRSKIRNLFLKYTQSHYLLFIDGDSAVPKGFLKKYADYLENNANTKVLVGASIYQNEKPALDKRLRWKYSTRRESLNFETRLKDSTRGFKSNNFIIKRSVFEKSRFDESLVGYGHEDTLFGYQLTKNSIQIEHIDNPVLNPHLDTNKEFLQKTENAIRNLLIISRKLEFSQDWVESQRMMRHYLKLQSSMIGKVFLFLIRYKQCGFRKILISGLSPLFVFDLYRINLLDKMNKRLK